MNKAQQRFGEPKTMIKAKVVPAMDAVVQEFICHAPFAVMATSNSDGDCDASPKGGRPGFVKVLDDKRLLVPDISGNKLFQSYENLETNPKVGLVFMIPGCNMTVRVNGRVRVLSADEFEQEGITAEVFDPDERAKTLQALCVDVDEVYPHCPRAFRFSRLWDIEQISENERERSDQFWFSKWSAQRADG